MKIAFVSANREKLPDPVVPIGVLYVMAATPDTHEKMLWDLCFEQDPIETLIAHLKAECPDVVALGLRNIQNSDYTGTSSNLRYYRTLIDTIRNHARATIVVGGGGFSVMPAELMAALQPDYGISGEGELAFPRLLNALEAGESARTSFGLVRSANDLTRIGGLHYFRNGEVVSNPPDSNHLDLDALTVPDRAQVDALYYTDVGTESVQTKRGCALRCDYCTYPIIEGRTVRKRDPATVVTEMIQLRNANPALSHFFIVDSVFNIPPQHAKDICREMIARELNTPWTCYANPLGFDAELAELMRASQCVGMEIGADSGCDEILEKLRKGFDTRKLREIHDLCAAAELRDCHTFLLGTPGETMDHVRRTLDFVIDMDPFAAVLLAYKDDSEALDPAYALERQRLRGQVLELLEEYRTLFPRWIIPALEVNFQTRLFELLRKRGMRGPLWQHLNLIPSAPKGPRTKKREPQPAQANQQAVDSSG